MKLYDNDAYRCEFMDGVYSLLSDDPTWDRANQIIDLFDAAPVAESESNKPLTLDELREMDLKEWAWIEVLEPERFRETVSSYYRTCVQWYDDKAFSCGYPGITFDFFYEDYGKTWLAYRRKPEEGAG